MPLEMKQNCETCDAETREDDVAYICSYECTYCADCATKEPRCPNCNGELQPRPRRGLRRGGPSMTEKRLRAFEGAWARADLEGLADFISDDCVYSASLGEEPGTTYVGKEEVMCGFAELIDYERSLADAASLPEGPTPESSLWVHGHRAFSHWFYPEVQPDGTTAYVRGFDCFEFDGRLIRRKDAFIKARR